MLVHEFLENTAARSPDKVALIFGGQRWTYRQINQAADNLANSLIHGGLQRQSRVVVFLDNSIESVVSLFGILKSGCVFVMANATMKAKKLNYIIDNSDASVLITHVVKKRVVCEAVQGCTKLDSIIWCQSKSDENIKQVIKSEGNSKKIITWFSILQQEYLLSSEKFPKTIDLDLAAIIYTSGSTGNPKGVVSAHYNMVAAIRSITTYLNNVENDIILSALPLSFDYGLYQVLMCFYFGGTIVLEKSFTYPVKIIERMKEENVTGFPIVPTMLSLLLRLGNLSESDFPSLRYISNTSAALPVSHILKLRSIFSRTQIYSMYGLTECKRVSYLAPDLIDDKPESVGIPMPNLEVFLVNSDGEEVDAGEIGELVVRGSTVMQGYWKLPEETSKVFHKNGPGRDVLLYSGDLFKKDSDGFLYFISRKDDIIKTKGERVSPKEIENALSEINGVIESAVIGVADDISGSAIKAFIVKEVNNPLTEKQIIKECLRNLEPFMIPKYVTFMSSFPKNNSGKIDKKRLSRESN